MMDRFSKIQLLLFVNFTDINECFELDRGNNSGPCGPEATCVNTFGSFFCRCRPGYTFVGGVCVGKSALYILLSYYFSFDRPDFQLNVRLSACLPFFIRYK